MSERPLATLTFTVVGLCFAIWGLLRIADTSFWLFDHGDRPEPGTILALLLPGVLGLAAGAWIWRRAEALASRTVMAEGGGSDQGVFGAEALLTIVLSGIAMFFLVEGLAGLAKSGTLLHLSRKGAPTSMDFNDKELWRAKMWDGFAKADMAAAAVRVFLGIGLLVGPKRLAAAFVKIRRELSGSLVRDQSRESPEAPKKQSGA